MSLDVCVVGSCVQDLISYAERFPKPGESVRAHSFRMGFGGKGANQAIMAARLGAKTAMVAKVGDDLFGRSTLDNFRDHCININHVTIAQGYSTSTATITVVDSGENSIVVELGANLSLSKEEVNNAEDVIKQAKVITCQLEVNVPITIEAMRIAKNNNVTTILNPAPGLPNLDVVDLLKYADYLCPNENEAEFLSGLKLDSIESAKIIAKNLLKFGPKVVIITMGSQGVIYCTQESHDPQLIPCNKVKAVDTTGAGDCFVGSLAFWTACHPEMTLEERIRRSMEIATISVTRPGTQTSYPKMNELPQNLRST